MATAHGISALTNSCVKPPVNPRTGHISTLSERKNNRKTFDDEIFANNVENVCPNVFENGVPAVASEEFKNIEAGTIASTDLLDVLTHQVSNLTDDEFYLKLQQLKNEHKNTLTMYEKLYNEKVLEQQDDRNVSALFSDDTNLHILRQSVERPIGESFDEEGTNEVLAKARSCWMGDSPQEPFNWKSRAINNSEELKNLMNKDYFWSDNDDDDDTPVVKTKDSRFLSSNAASKIEDMWDNFSLDDYPASTERSPYYKTAKARKTVKKPDSWRHRVTIPKPFKMTVRDEQKPKKKTKAMIDLEQKLIEEKRQEELECQKKFKARPVPAHVYIPLFDEVMEKAETQRRINREINKEILKSKEQPFNFMKREEDKKRHKHDRVHSAPCHYRASPIKPSFKARPVPKAVNDESVMDRIREEEEYRKIRMTMRAEELMKSASLPPSMEAREKAQIMYNKMLKESTSKKRRSRNVVVSNVRDPPDFDTLHKKFQKEMVNNLKMKESTVCKPFLLRTSSIPSNLDKIQDDIKADEEKLKETRWPFKNKRTTPRSSLGSLSLSRSLDNIPAKLTASAELRLSANRDRLHNLSKKERDQLERQKNRRLREKQLKRQIAEKAAANDQSTSLKETETDKLKKFKQAERERAIEYQKELREMREKLKNRPLLFEQQSQTNARKQAEKRYSDTIRNAGLDEDFINTKGTRTTNFDVSDEYEFSEDEQYEEV